MVFISPFWSCAKIFSSIATKYHIQERQKALLFTDDKKRRFVVGCFRIPLTSTSALNKRWRTIIREWMYSWLKLLVVIGPRFRVFFFHHSSTGIESRFGHGAAVANGACGDEKTWKRFFLFLPALDQLLQIHWPFITDSLTCQSCEHVLNWFVLGSVYDNLCNMESKSQRATVQRDAR